MAKFAFQHQRSCYLKTRPGRRKSEPKKSQTETKRSAWRLYAKDVGPDFQFPLHEAFEELWKRIAPREAEIKCYVSDHSQLVFTVPVGTLTPERKKQIQEFMHLHWIDHQRSQG